MNITELEYVVAIDRYGSISAAARELYAAQPNISKALKNLESEYQIQIFQRSASGMTPTVEGQKFIEQAARILREWNTLKDALDPAGGSVSELKVALPRASYATLAATHAVRELAEADYLYINIRECGCTDALKNVLENGYHMALLRYPAAEHEQYLRYFERKGLVNEVIMAFRYQLLVSRDSPLADMEIERYSQLTDYIEIIHEDDYVQNGGVRAFADQHPDKKYISVYERGSQFELLRELKNAYIWTSPVPPEILERHGTVQREVPVQTTEMLDVLVYRRGEMRKELRRFAEHLRAAAEAACPVR